MSKHTKLRGGGAALTRLKQVWRTLPDDERAYWQDLFGSPATLAAIRGQILAKFNIDLRYDTQVNRFRAWEQEQRALDEEAERQERDLALELKKNPKLSLAQAREKMLIIAYARAQTTGDFKLGLAVIQQDVHVKKVELDARKLKLLEAKAAQADSAKQVTESKMSAEEKEAEYRRIFGMA